jgi:sporulation protein YabP
MDEQTPHRLTLDRRSRLTVSGVDEVASFHESSIRMTTQAGVLLVRGSALHIEKLSLDGGDLLVEGTVDALIYEEPEEPVSFLSRLLRG